jgi:molybdate transport system substrate-binding protein
MKLKAKIKSLSISCLLLLPTFAMAQSEVIVFVGGAMTKPATEVGVIFDNKSDNTTVIESDTTGELQKRLAAAEKADLVIVTAPAMEMLEQQNLVIVSSTVDLALALIGVGIHPDGTAPDLSTAETFKAALLGARSVAYVSPAAGGTSGTYFEGLLESMGISEVMQPKIVYQTQGSEVAQAVASGDAEFGITFVSELKPNPGLIVAGTFPDEIQLPTIYAVSIATASKNKEGAQALLDMLAGAEGRAALVNIGLEPIAPTH